MKKWLTGASWSRRQHLCFYENPGRKLGGKSAPLSAPMYVRHPARLVRPAGHPELRFAVAPRPFAYP